jgi:hypothetical protein
MDRDDGVYRDDPTRVGAPALERVGAERTPAGDFPERTGFPEPA